MNEPFAPKMKPNHGLIADEMKCPLCGYQCTISSCSSGSAKEYHIYSGPMRITCTKCRHQFERDFQAYKVSSRLEPMQDVGELVKDAVQQEEKVNKALS